MLRRTVRAAAGAAVSAATLPARVVSQALATPIPDDVAADAAPMLIAGGAGDRDPEAVAVEAGGRYGTGLPDEDVDHPLPDLEELIHLVEGGAELLEDVVEEGFELIGDTLGLHRRVWEDEDHDHAQIEVHGIDDPAAVGFRRRLAQALQRTEAVRWAEVNAITGRVAVAFDGGQPTLAKLVELIEGLEDTFGARPDRDGAAWDTADRADHPADDEPVHRTIAIMAGDALSLAWTAVGRAAHLPRLPAELSGVVSIVDNNPWLRLQAQRALGRRAAALVLPLVSAATAGVTQGPLGTMIDLGHQGASLGELRARRRVWEELEPLFYADADDHGPIDPPAIGPRPQPLPEGPIEQLAAESAKVGLGAAGLALALTRNPRRAADVLLASSPKAARLGREGFAALLGRTLAYRGIVPLDGSALRRLDRIDTVVLDADVLLRDGPEGAVEVPEDEVVLDDAVTTVVDAVRAAGHRLLVADRDGQVAAQLGADDRLPGGDALGEAIRELQAEGAGVMVIGRQGHAGLAAADVGLGVLGATGRPSWGADLILGRELADAATIVAATTVAREVSVRSAKFAATGSALGGLVTVTGPPAGAGSRALAMVNGAAGAALVSGSWAAVQLSHAPRPRPTERVLWHALAPDEVLAELDVDEDDGLATAAAAQRRTVTSLAGREVTPLEPFLAELANPLNPVLAAGAGLSAATGSMSDAALVLGLIGVNTAVGGVQRLRADRTVRQLLERDVEAVTVRRDGVEQQVTEDQLVRGDVLVLRAGDAVPADARVLWVDGCEVDEASLTGESLPVSKSPEATPDAEIPDRRCMLYEDTTVVAGSVRAVVVATGEHTEVARSLALTGPPPPTGVELRLEELTRRLLPAALGVAGLTAGVGALRRWPMTDVAGTAVALAIASVPEGLPFVATAGQLAGARRLARGGAVVRNPRTVEALGRVDVLCVDKTGTLTEGRVAVAGVSDGRTIRPIDELDDHARHTLLTAMRASDQPADEGRGLAELDDADQALHRVTARLTLDPAGTLGAWTVVDDLPFEASRGLHAVLGRNGRDHQLLVKGAPEVLLDVCDTWVHDEAEVELDGAARAEVSAHVDELARAGHRLLAVAERPASSDPEVDERRIERLRLRGFILLADPVRDTAAAAVQGIARAGVRTIMVTGDHPETAASIARQLGIDTGGRLLTGPDLDELDDDELATALEQVQVVARVTPAAKLRVVEALQGAGHVVAMTGDGANDAAAIRLAEVGVALGQRSSAAARDAADILITDDRVETLIDAIAEGRALWASIREALAVLVGGNLGEIGFTTVASAFSSSAPLHPRQFLLVNLFTDLAPAVAIAVRPPRDVSADVLLREGPEASLGDSLRRDIAVRGTATAAGASAAWTAARLTGTRRRAGTVGLVALVGTQLGQTLAAGGWREPATLLTVGGSALGLVAAVQTPVVSHFFGSRPLGPLGWSQAVSASVAATVGSEVANRLAVRLDDLRAAEAAEAAPGPPPRSRRAPATELADGPSRVLVAGGDAPVLDAFVPALLDEGHEVAYLVADPDTVTAPWRDRVELVAGDLGDEDDVAVAARRCAVAYHLADVVRDGGVLTAEAVREEAAGFAGGVDLAGVARVVRLGTLLDDATLARSSELTFARQQVGEELRIGPVPVTELRAGPVLADGAGDLALLRALVRSGVRLPRAVAEARVQPVAPSDLAAALVAASAPSEHHHQVLDVAGPDVVTVGDLHAEVADRVPGRPGPRLWAPAPVAGSLAAGAARAAGVPLPVAAAVLGAWGDDRVAGRHVATPPPRTAVDDALAAALAGASAA